MVEKPKTEVDTDNGLPPSVLSGSVSHSSSGDRTVPWFRKSSMVWIWQHDKRTDDYKIILNLCKKIDENKSEKEAGKGPIFLKKRSIMNKTYKDLITRMIRHPYFNYDLKTAISSFENTNPDVSVFLELG
jgi:hypothetical protein